MFRFASLYFFLVLLLIPVIIVYRRRYHIIPAMRISRLRGDALNKSGLMLRIRSGLPILPYAALVLMICGLARPQWGTQKINITTEGINIVLAVDLSESMQALDFKRDGKIINRLEAIKGVVRDFIQKRNGDRIGLVVFGSEAYTQIPLTRDYNTIASILDRLKIGAAGSNTAIGDAIGISLKRLEDIESKSNVIILLTDGRSNAGELSPETTLEIAGQKGVKIYTIGVGTRGKAPIPVKHPLLGEQYVYQQVDIDEDLLKKVAEQTNGLYFRAEDTQGLEKICQTIDQLEKTEVKVDTFAEYRELYPWLLIPAFVLICLWIILINTRFLEVP